MDAHPVEPSFREVQRFWRNPWIVVFLVPLYAVLGWATSQQVVLGRPFGTDPAPDWTWLLLDALALGLPFYPYLVTEVGPRSLRVRFPPRRGLELTADDVSSFMETTYRPMREFGGWGYRIGRGGKRAYNVAGKRGVRLHLADGRQLVIGSQRPDELAAAIAEAFD